jgi:hypothetical protein
MELVSYEWTIVIPEDEFVGVSEFESIMSFAIGNYSQTVSPRETQLPEEVFMRVGYQASSLRGWTIVDGPMDLVGHAFLARADPISPNYLGMLNEFDTDDFTDWKRRGVDTSSLLGYVSEWDWESRPPWLVYFLVPREYEMFLGSVGQALMCNTSAYVIQSDPCDALYAQGRGWFFLS